MYVPPQKRDGDEEPSAGRSLDELEAAEADFVQLTLVLPGGGGQDQEDLLQGCPFPVQDSDEQADGQPKPDVSCMQAAAQAGSAQHSRAALALRRTSGCSSPHTTVTLRWS